MRSWWTVAGIFVALGLIAGYRLIADAGSLLDWLILVLIVAAGAAAIVHHNAVASLEAGADLPEVVDLAVEDDLDRVVLVAERLVAAGDVDDR